jgi:hypothetical protein
MLRDLYERQAGAQAAVDETTAGGFGRNMKEMAEFVKAQRTYNVSRDWMIPET